MTLERILIISPVSRYGGVNLEVGFLADLLNKEFEVKVISTGDYYADSSVFHFNWDLNFSSLHREVYNSNFWIRKATDILCFFKPRPVPNDFRVSNKLTKWFKVEKKKINFLEQKVSEADIILLCTQLTAKYNKEIISHARTKNKKIILRTTGAVHPKTVDKTSFQWLNKTDIILYHSKNNKEKTEGLLPHPKHIIIDQHAILEDKLLSQPLISKQVKHFFVLGRLHHIKNVESVIKAFINVHNQSIMLHIYGDGEEEHILKELAKGYSNIKFYGKKPAARVPEIFKANDCLIISSLMESGPYTGVEAMASGTPIISTEVGAMTDRMGENYSFFYDGSTGDLINKLLIISNLPEEEVYNLSKKLRNKYLESNTQKHIEKKYLNLFKSL